MLPYGRKKNDVVYEGDNHNRRRTRQNVKITRAFHKRARQKDREIAEE
jgi:hypothetical protein